MFKNKIIWLTDLHIRADSAADRIDPVRNLTVMVDDILRFHDDADAVLVTGDLTDSGAPEQYQIAAEALAPLPMPVLPIAGNHDTREGLRSAFPELGGGQSDSIQYRVDIGDLTILCLDTLEQGDNGGTYGQTRLDWLEKTLGDCRRRRTIIAIHHPPLQLGLGPLDTIALRDPGPLLDLLSGADHIEHILIGHVHRATTGTIRGIPYSTLRSLSHQNRAPLTDWGWSENRIPNEAPQYGVILSSPDSLVIQTIDLGSE